MEESKSILSSSEDKRPPDLVSSGFSASDQALIARDEFKASLYFAAIGVGYLFPFSALTQPVDYWHMLFPQFDVDLDITACYMWVNLIALGLIVFCASSEPNYSVRIVSGFVGQLIILVVVP